MSITPREAKVAPLRSRPFDGLAARLAARAVLWSDPETGEVAEWGEWLRRKPCPVARLRRVS